MTHTPGPWLINFDPEDDERPLEIVTSDRDHRIAFLASDGNPDDARLISAAPALYEALKALMPSDFDDHPQDFSEEWHAARAALALADGET